MLKYLQIMVLISVAFGTGLLVAQPNVTARLGSKPKSGSTPVSGKTANVADPVDPTEYEYEYEVI